MMRTFSRIRYLALAFGVALACFFSLAWLPAASLISAVASEPGISLSHRLSLMVKLLVTLPGDIDVMMLSYTALLSLLVGINCALLIFYFKMFRAAPSALSIGSGVLAAFSAALGFGCAACGTVFLSAFLATLGGAGFIAALPFQGVEFAGAALALSAFSVAILARAINRPVVCPI